MNPRLLCEPLLRPSLPAAQFADTDGEIPDDLVLARQAPIVQGCILLTAFGFVIINLIVDLLYSYFDPRIVYEG